VKKDRVRGVRGVLAGLLLAVAPLVFLGSAGCAEPPPQKWSEVTSGEFAAASPGFIDLGTFNFAGEVRLAWTLKGPADARSIFRLRVARSTKDGGLEASTASVRSWSRRFSPRDDFALYVGGLEPDEYRVTVSQRFDRGHKSGYGGRFTLYVTVVQ
jgi:hypothetical protein